MKRTFSALILFILATALMAYGSLRLDKKCNLMMEEIQIIIDNQEDFSKPEIEKRMDKLLKDFDDDNLAFSCVLGPSESEEVKNAIRRAKNELLISPDEEFPRNLFAIKLQLEQIKKEESFVPQNLI